MKLFQHHYYNTNKIFLSIVGLWPYQTIGFSRSILSVIWFLKISGLAVQILAVVKYRDDWKILADCGPPLLLTAMTFTKLICCTWNSRKMFQLLNDIRTDLAVWAGDEEINIFHKYAKQAKNITVAYAGALFSFGALYMGQPMLPKLIDSLLRNGSEIGQFPLPVDYYELDKDKYYFHIMLHMSLCMTVEAVITVACDTIFMVYLQHGCSLFSAIGHKLQRAKEVGKSTEIGQGPYVMDESHMVHDHIASCIDRHNHAIAYAELIEVTYSSYLLLDMVYTIMGNSLTGIQFINSLKYNEGMSRYLFAILANTLHIYMYCYFCQRIVDHSISIRYYIHNSNWYKLPSKDQKLLGLVIVRSTFPCKLTAGKICVMSVETFVAIVKMSVSYFTVLRSL